MPTYGWGVGIDIPRSEDIPIWKKRWMQETRMGKKKRKMIMGKQERLLWNSRIPGRCECKEFGVMFQVLIYMERKCEMNGEEEGKNVQSVLNVGVKDRMQGNGGSTLCTSMMQVVVDVPAVYPSLVEKETAYNK